MSDGKDMEQPLVFGLDIGTRNVVGTVGYRTEDQFIVTAQYIMQHDTRAMLDGQIHDIGRVSGTIRKVKEQLEKLSKELLEGYEAYVQENGYPDPAKMGEYFMDYLGTDSAKQELSAGLMLSLIHI